MLAVFLVSIVGVEIISGSDVDIRRGKLERAIKSKLFLNNREVANGLETKMRSKKGNLQRELSNKMIHF
jgi:hypothetical protein